MGLIVLMREVRELQHAEGVPNERHVEVPMHLMEEEVRWLQDRSPSAAEAVHGQT